MAEILMKRIYDPKDESDGLRILVDRLWPRGIKKEDAGIDYWYKELAPSAELRKWFAHIPERFEEFRLKYFIELTKDEMKSNRVDELVQIVLREKATLLYAAKNHSHNNAVVLKEELLRRISLKQNPYK
ncbi:DUF488 family protein [Bacillus sp. DNRA2]|uniref:DUF488 domain-containing protein n=1 Tax=Bacillus sp. DNRA2 TaxID=2723053 RepID=UPI00145CAC4D|nr:DUF488 family protein [Bacillus sp. DNRA2]NMD69336.1 DUF488 family protein [Bacillus sp. DNRA2]